MEKGCRSNRISDLSEEWDKVGTDCICEWFGNYQLYSRILRGFPGYNRNDLCLYGPFLYKHRKDKRTVRFHRKIGKDIHWYTHINIDKNQFRVKDILEKSQRSQRIPDSALWRREMDGDQNSQLQYPFLYRSNGQKGKNISVQNPCVPYLQWKKGIQRLFCCKKTETITV